MQIVILKETANCLASFVTYKLNADLSHCYYVDFIKNIMEINSTVSISMKKNVPSYELCETYMLFKQFKKIKLKINKP